MFSVTLISDSPAKTRSIAGNIAQYAQSGEVYCLEGGLASGKTVFAQGFASALGIVDRVTSPSFTIIQEYNSHPPFYHIDLYRVDNTQALYDIGFDELIASNGICLIEWSERARSLIPARAMRIAIRILESGDREIRLQANEPRIGEIMNEYT